MQTEEQKSLTSNEGGVEEADNRSPLGETEPLAGGDKKSPKKSQSSRSSISKSSSSSSEASDKKHRYYDRNLPTHADDELGELTEAERELMAEDWSEFKTDVSMKTLINKLDKGIKRRYRLYYSDDPEEMEKLINFRRTYKKLKPIKLICVFFYIFLPFMEKPAWCLRSPQVDRNTTQGYWYCENAADTIKNSNIPKLPP